MTQNVTRTHKAKRFRGGLATSLLLALAACNPLGGSLKDSAFQDGYQPGLPDSFKNKAPVAVDASAAFDEDTPGVVTLSYQDTESDLATDCEVSSLTNVAITQACSCDVAGTCTVGVSGLRDYYGPASFAYSVTANDQVSNAATASLAIAAVNDPPTISNITDTSTSEDVAKTVTFTIADVESTLACDGGSLSLVSGLSSVVADASVVWSGTPPYCTATFTPVPDAHGSTTLRVTVTDATLTTSDEFVLTVNLLEDDVVSDSWSFDALSAALYTFSSALLRFASGIVELIGADQVDSDNTASGFAGGSRVGVVWDGDRLILGNAGGCDSTSSNCAEFDESWTPQWSSLVSYWAMNPSDISGPSLGDRSGRGNAGTLLGSPSVVPARVLSGLSLNGTTQRIDAAVTATSQASYAQLTIGAWVKFDAIDGVREIFGRTNGATSYQTEGSFGLDLGVTGEGFVGFHFNDGEDIRFDSRFSPTVGTWYHLVGTYDSATNTTAFYVNGKSTNQDSQGTSAVPALSGAFFRSGWWETSGDYTFPFSGAIDEVAVWSKALSPAEVAMVYGRQSPRFSGTFASRVMDGLSDDSMWTTLSWVPTLPFMKELPDSTCVPVAPATTCAHNAPESNSASGYTSLVGSGGTTATNDLMSGITGLWHLNETSLASAPDGKDFKDSSGQSHHGISYASTLGVEGRFNRAANMESGCVEIPPSSVLNQRNKSFSASLWIRQTAPIYGEAMLMEYDVWEHTTSNYQITFLDSTTLRVFSYGMGANAVDGIDYTWSPQMNVWHHIAMTHDFGASLTNVYVDGSLVKTATSSLYLSDEVNSLWIGCRGGYSNLFPGSIDEVAMWGRALHANEIKQLYQRGASRLKHQVRTCDDAECLGEAWKGPDGTSGTYFSELNNNSVPLAGSGTVKATLPSMLFSAFSPPSPPSPNRYFQYRTFFETDSSLASDGPELKSVSVDPIHYPTEATIYGNNGVRFESLSSFTESLGAGSCASGIGYNLSLDKTNWKYWNGSAWAPASGSVAQSNTAAVIQANAPVFGSTVGRGTVYFKAFLRSSGTSKCELDNILIEGIR